MPVFERLAHIRTHIAVGVHVHAFESKVKSFKTIHKVLCLRINDLHNYENCRSHTHTHMYEYMHKRCH